jgi:hypothetical protein
VSGSEAFSVERMDANWPADSMAVTTCRPRSG